MTAPLPCGCAVICSDCAIGREMESATMAYLREQKRKRPTRDKRKEPTT